MMPKFIIAVAALSLSSFAALAETPAPAPAAAGHVKVSQACSSEITKFCADVEKGKGLRRACLESHTADLTDGCKTSLAERAKAKGEKSQTAQ